MPFGVNPKTILCAFHKAGTCTKGDRCKFSHDLNIERKTTKRDLYTDNRDEEKKNGRLCFFLLFLDGFNSETPAAATWYKRLISIHFAYFL